MYYVCVWAVAWSLCFLGETLSHSAPPFSLPPSWGVGTVACALCFLGETLTQCFPPLGVGAVAGHYVSWVRHSHSAHTLPPPPPCGAEAVACALCFLGETLSHSAPKGIKIFSLERRETWWKFVVPRNPEHNSIRLLKITSVFEGWGLFVLDQFLSRRHTNDLALYTLIPGTCFSKILGL